MRLLHCADLHVGCGKTFPDSLGRSRDVLREILQIAREYEVDFIVVAGDWFDRSAPTHDERALVSKFFAKSPAPIISITGNHDMWGSSLGQTAMNWLTHIASEFGHRVWDTPTAEEYDGVWWLALPHGSWNSAEVYLLTHWLLAHVPEDWEGPVIGLAHEFFSGAMMDSGFTGRGRKYAQLEAAAHDIDYWALGDIHKMQKMASNAWYCGAPAQMDFGEALPKGVLIVEFGSKGAKRPEFVEMTRPKRLIELTEVPEVWPDAYIKLTVRPEDIPHPKPECVVRLGSTAVPASSQEIKELHEIVSAKFLLDGMQEWLTSKGFGPKMVKRGLKMAESLVKKVQK